MTIANLRRLRAERSLPQALREALRELPNSPPKPAQLDELRHKLGLAAPALDAPVLVPDRRLRERRLRRTVIALVFFPIAATAAVGTVLDLTQRSARSAGPATGSAVALPRSRLQGPPVRVVPPLATSPTVVSEDSASSTPPASVANSVRYPRAASTALASGHVELASPTTDTEERVRASELELLQRANAALKADPALAQALTVEHRRRFPAGNLSQEREAIAIKALVALGDSLRARDSLARFEQAYPHSAHALELRQIVH
jgi:hypothetical protein